MTKLELENILSGITGELTSEQSVAFNEYNELMASIDVSKKYLADTDFYYARKLEIGEDVPADVVAKRIEARNLIRSAEG